MLLNRPVRGGRLGHYMTRTKVWGLCVSLVLVSACDSGIDESETEPLTTEEEIDQALSGARSWAMEHGATGAFWWEGDRVPSRGVFFNIPAFTFEKTESLENVFVTDPGIPQWLPFLGVSDITRENDQYRIHFFIPLNEFSVPESFTERGIPSINFVLNCDQAQVDRIIEVRDAVNEAGNFLGGFGVPLFDVVAVIDSVELKPVQRILEGYNRFGEGAGSPTLSESLDEYAYGACRAVRPSTWSGYF